MNYDQKLTIARLVYADIIEVIDKWHPNGTNPLTIGFHWDNYISVDHQIFNESQLLVKEEGDYD